MARQCRVACAHTAQRCHVGCGADSDPAPVWQDVLTACQGCFRILAAACLDGPLLWAVPDVLLPVFPVDGEIN